MQIFVFVLLGVYVLAINLFGILNLNFQRKESIYSDGQSKSISDFKLILVGALGGALGIFIFMFIFKYKLKSLLLMILMPLLATINVFLITLAIRSGYGYFFFRENLSPAVSLLLYRLP